MNEPLLSAFIEDTNKMLDDHSLCPYNLVYNAVGLTGEAGEVANNIKKLQMIEIRPEWVQSEGNQKIVLRKETFEDNLSEELSDTLFYVLRLARDRGLNIADLVSLQQNKLLKQSEQYGRKFLK